MLRIVVTWSGRLMVRTPGFHPGNRGSIPRRTTSSGNAYITDQSIFSRDNDTYHGMMDVFWQTSLTLVSSLVISQPARAVLCGQ